MKRNGVVLIVIAGLVALMIYAGVRISRDRGGAVTSASLKQGSVAPDFELKTLDGKPVKLSSFRGKAVLLNFWATWCGPCKVETPWLVDFYKHYQPQGLEIVGVSMDDSGSGKDIAQFVKEMNVNYTVLEGNDAVGDEYGGINGLPVSFFIDRNGKIVKMVEGLTGKGDLEADIKQALANPVQTASAGDPAAK